VISFEDVVRLRSAEVADESLEVKREDLVERVATLEAEKVALLAENTKLREVLRLSLKRDEHQAAADAVRREQLDQFLTSDFPND
jgi:regulator of replication initiation timing